ncbi:PTS sugar transporter subunit IIA, partial [Streptococcus orisratti]
MKIQDLLKKDVMLLDLKATSKEAAIDEMITNLVNKGIVSDFDTFKAGIMNREAQMTTGLGEGVAMPHSKNAAVKEATVLFAKSASGVDYEALDGAPVDLFFMIAAPDGANDTHLAALADLSKYLLKDGFADKLRQVKSADEVIATFDAAEDDNKADANQTTTPKEGQDFIVAV